ncbi:MAG: hypothetical protein CMP10_04940 [Zetaproteobacteria bacterium]|nr:hypothetical protein [Pseudobdellovibrionaceae bacterium]
MTNQYIATCPEEITTVVANELSSLGAQQVKPEFKAVSFSADLETAYKIHLKLTSASRILRVLHEGSAATPNILFTQAQRVPWTEIIPEQSTWKCNGIAGDRGPQAMSSNDISKKIREALQASFEKRGLKPPSVNIKEPKVVITAYVHRNRVTISLDTSGKTLHKRGYRSDKHPAPIKETLGAAILKLAGYDGSQVLLDPMCGSGTIAIEAAFQGINKAPLIHRKKGEFGFEWLLDFDRKLWREVQDETRREKKEALSSPIFAQDISESYSKTSQENALRARVEKHLQFRVQDFLNSKPPAEKGLIVTNLPYGTRIGTQEFEEMKSFYGEIGNTLKRNYTGWRAAILTAIDTPWKFIGLRPSRKINILNGSIPCKLLIFDLYEGGKKSRESDRRLPQ